MMDWWSQMNYWTKPRTVGMDSRGQMGLSCRCEFGQGGREVSDDSEILHLRNMEKGKDIVKNSSSYFGWVEILSRASYIICGAQWKMIKQEPGWRWRSQFSLPKVLLLQPTADVWPPSDFNLHAEKFSVPGLGVSERPLLSCLLNVP